MRYQALYRAWRPETFSQIVGQDAVVRTLRHQVETGRVAHAYLFCGTRGTGKTTAAKVLSRAINCLHPVDGDPCGECDVCLQLKKENSMDVIEIDAASNNGVDEIRDLREKVKYPPAVAKYKVYIIDEVHMLSTGAFNALLKTLEEPPAHAVFILATTEPQRLPATILSRCQRFDFRRLSVETMVERMMVVLGGIGRTASDEALHEIARAARARCATPSAYSTSAFPTRTGRWNSRWCATYWARRGASSSLISPPRCFPATPAARFCRSTNCCEGGWTPRCSPARWRSICARCCWRRPWARRQRNFWNVRPRTHSATANRRAAPCGNSFSASWSCSLRVEPDMKWAADPRAMLELTAVRACCPEGEKDVSLAERVGHLEAAIERGAVAAPAKEAPKPAKAPAPAKERAPKAAPPPKSAAEAPPQYLQAVEALSKANPSMRAALEGMKFAGYDGDVVTAEFARKQLMFMKMLERKREPMEAAFTEAFGAPTKLVMRLEGDAAPQGATAAQARRVIEQSYDVFGRENIDLTD